MTGRYLVALSCLLIPCSAWAARSLAQSFFITAGRAVAGIIGLLIVVGVIAFLVWGLRRLHGMLTSRTPRSGTFQTALVITGALYSLFGVGWICYFVYLALSADEVEVLYLLLATIGILPAFHGFPALLAAWGCLTRKGRGAS